MIDFKVFLNNKDAEKFLNENSERIFGIPSKIKIIDLKLSFTYFPALNVSYDIERNGQNESIRLSASTKLSKQNSYKLMQLFQKNGFDKNGFLTPKPIAYLKDENILFYEELEGKQLSKLLDKSEATLIDYSIRSAYMIKKFHSVQKPVFKLHDHWKLYQDYKIDVLREYSGVGVDLVSTVRNIISFLKQQEKSYVLCHGDYNLNNILIDGSKTGLLDFDLCCLFWREVDLASFLTHLRFEINNEDLFKKLKTTFLSHYGEMNNLILKKLTALLDIRLLEISIVYPKSKFKSNFISECLKEDLT